MKTAKYITVKVASSLLVLLIVIFITFAVFNLWPSDPAVTVCGKPCTPERLAQVQALMGSNDPWYIQFGHYITGIFQSRTYGEGFSAIVCAAPCLGYSFRMGEPVTQILLDRLPVSISIAVGASVLWLVTSVVFGVISAVKRGTVIDKTFMSIAVFGVSAPAYLIGFGAISIFGFKLGWLPSAGYVELTSSPLQWFTHLILPWLTLTLLYMAVYTRLIRAKMIETLGYDYISASRAKGLRESKVITSHALPTVMVPVVTLFALDLGGLLGGAVITEKIFSMQGLGALLVDAVSTSDLPVITAIVVISAGFVIVANLIVDILHSVMDPRVNS